MADAETLRVQVHLSPDLHPEVFGAVADLRPRGRAERLRQLALMGLTGVRVGMAERAQSAESDSKPSPLPEPEPARLAPARARLLEGLTLTD